jgi:predicted regulator of Ras-like GTPase activity (Roadblock/LC7/MglB family)
MGTLPRLIEDDIERLDEVLRDLLRKTGATIATVIDQGGFLIASQGDARQFDLTTIAAPASGSYLANQTIANLVHEDNFSSVYQHGEKNSLFVVCVDQHCMLAVIFGAQVGVGVVKYYAAGAIRQIADQLRISRVRAPDASLDLSVLNLADTSDLFGRKA